MKPSGTSPSTMARTMSGARLAGDASCVLFLRQNRNRLHERIVPLVPGTLLKELLFAATHHSSAFFQPLSGVHTIFLSCSYLRHGPRKVAILITISSNSRGASDKWFFRQKACHWTDFSGRWANSTVRAYGSSFGSSVPRLWKVFSMAVRNVLAECSARRESCQMS